MLERLGDLSATRLALKTLEKTVDHKMAKPTRLNLNCPAFISVV